MTTNPHDSDSPPRLQVNHIRTLEARRKYLVEQETGGTKSDNALSFVVAERMALDAAIAVCKDHVAQRKRK